MRILLGAMLILGAPLFGADEKPVDPRPDAVQVQVDTSEVPDLEPWGAKAKALVEKWHPIVADLLKSDGFTPPSKVKIVFKKDMKGVAYTSGNTITIAADWIKKSPDDYGMVVHELTHVIQSYPRAKGNAGWLVEGIADYVRFYKYEPKTKLGPILNPDASYRLGYRAAAQFWPGSRKRMTRTSSPSSTNLYASPITKRRCSRTPQAKASTTSGPTFSKLRRNNASLPVLRAATVRKRCAPRP